MKIAMVLQTSATLSLSFSAAASGQCLDWAQGFGIPGNGLDGAAYATTVFDEDGPGPLPPALFVGGFFNNAGNVPAKGIARWNGTTWSALGAGLGGVTALAVYDDGTGPALFAAGQFSTGGGAPSTAIAKWNGTTWVGVGGGLGNNAWSLHIFDDGAGPALFVGGDFTSAGGQLTDRIASWNGASWRTFSGGPSARTGHMMAYDPVRGKTVVFGGLTSGGGAAPQSDTWTFDGAAWSRVATTGPAPRSEGAMAFDSIRSRVLLFGGKSGPSDTWSWNGATWSQIIGAGKPTTARYAFQIVHDTARDRMVLFGGQTTCCTQVQLNDTWEFNGTQWLLVPVASPPPARSNYGMAYDPSRQRTVMFGGYNSTQNVGQETWEYDGATWVQVAAGGPPGIYQNSGLAYDTALQRVVLGCAPDGTGLASSWAWDGAAWTMIAPANPAISDRMGPIVYDSGRNRFVQRTNLAQTWEFDNAAWTQFIAGGANGSVLALCGINTPTGPELFVGGNFSQAGGLPSPRAARLTSSGWKATPGLLGSVNALCAYDSGTGPQMYAGGPLMLNGNTLPASTARWNGTSWVIVPGALYGDSRGLAVLNDGHGPELFAVGNLGNLAGTPTLGIGAWNGATWRTPGMTTIPGRNAAAAAYDSARSTIVMFGGLSTAGTPLGDTALWDGRSWIGANLPGPSPRARHAMAFDSAHNRVVLVGGGSSAQTADSQTWTWDGTQWALAAAAFGASARYGHAMAFDSDRARVVLFGGMDSAGQTTGDTWEWDGAAWQQVASGGPISRFGHAMAYDPLRHRTVLYAGGTSGGGELNDTWIWDGAAWLQVTTPPNFPGARTQHAMAFDAIKGKVVMQGGRTAGNTRDDCWEWNGTTWTDVGSTGSRRLHTMVYEAGLQRLSIFGGFNASNEVLGDTWVRSASGWASPFLTLSGANTLAAFGSSVYVGGGFSNAAGVPSRNLAQWGVPCTAPVITLQPVNLVAQWAQTPQMTVGAIGTAPLAYQWRKNGVNLTDGGHFSGVNSVTLSFNWWAYGDEGNYDVVVTNPRGSATSASATFEVPVPGSGLPVAVVPALYPPEPAPGMPSGAYFGSFQGAQMSPSEDVATLATINGVTGSSGIRSIVLRRNGATTIIAKMGDQAPGVPAGIVFGSSSGGGGVGEPVLGDEGRLSFAGELQGPGMSFPQFRGYWYRDELGMELMLRGADPAPGFPPATTFTSLEGLRMNNAGVALLKSVTTNGTGVWTWAREVGLSLVIRTGATAPGTSATLTSMTGPVPKINDAGIIALGGSLSDGAAGVWMGNAGSLQLILQTPSQAPGMPPGTQILSNVWDWVPVLGSGGHLAFRAQLTDLPAGMSRWALYRWDGSTISAVVLPGQPAPGCAPGATFFTTQPVAINSLGHIVFQGTVLNPGTGPTFGLWIADSIGIAPLVLNNSGPLPGVPSQLNFVSAGEPAVINDSGQVVFGCEFSFGTTYNSVMGWTRGTGLFPIATPGTQLEVRSGEFRTVLNGYLPSVASSEICINLNAAGTTTLDIALTDGSRGVFMGIFSEFAGAFIPCPSILTPPQSLTMFEGGALVLHAVASGFPTPTYLWRRDGVPVLNGGPVSGATTDTLTINPATPAHSGSYELIATNTCGSVTSPAAAVVVVCYPNCDMSTSPPALNVNDFVCFLNRYAAGAPYANCDGSTAQPVLNVNDFVCFLNRFAVGCP